MGEFLPAGFWDVGTGSASQRNGLLWFLLAAWVQERLLLGVGSKGEALGGAQLLWVCFLGDLLIFYVGLTKTSCRDYF